MRLAHHWRMWRWRRYWKARKERALHPEWASWLNSGRPLEENPWPL